MNKNSLFTDAVIVSLCLFSAGTVHAEVSGPVTIGNYLISASFADALRSGMNVPVYIKYSGDTATEKSRQKVADAVIVLGKDNITIHELQLADEENKTELSASLKKFLKSLRDQEFDANNQIALPNGGYLGINLKSFYLELNVAADDLVPALIPRSDLLGSSSSDSITSVLNYTVGSYYNKFRDSENTNSFITLDSTTSLRENHLNMNGSLYGAGTGEQSFNLTRALIERDYAGNRMAVGMVDSWDLQSVASMNYLKAGKIYGVSYGNKSNTRINNTSLSMTPITVFMPAAGQVAVYRDKKLLSIQNFDMGNYEVDTSKLPYGVYAVDVKVIVNGTEVSSRQSLVNKTFALNRGVPGEFNWQVFSGMLDYQTAYNDDEQQRNAVHEQSWLAGVAGGTSVAVNESTSLSLKSTLYGFNQRGVSESDVRLTYGDYVSVDQRWLMVTDRSWQSSTTLSGSLPWGLGSVWGTRGHSAVKDKRFFSEDDMTSFGASLNLKKIHHSLGMLTVSKNRNQRTGNQYTYIDYSQTLHHSRYGTLSMRAGAQQYRYRNSDDTTRDKYINFEMSVPFSTWFSAGLSSQNGNTLLNASLRKRLEKSAINQAGLSMSKKIQGGQRNTAQDFLVSGYMGYETKHNAGTVTVSRNSAQSTGMTLSTQGAVMLAGHQLGMSKDNFTSGIIVNTALSDNANVAAKINGKNYVLSGKSTFIGLPAYARYQVELMNDKNSQDSVNIVSGKKSVATLYPGNVIKIEPEIKQMVTVFGRLKDAQGQLIADTEIHNHIGRTRTDDAGNFAMDIDKKYPFISIAGQKGSLCEAELNLKDSRGAVWVGDIQCLSQSRVARR